MKKTEIATVGAMNNTNQVAFDGQDTKGNDPNVSETSGNHQSGEPFWITDVTFVQMKAATLLVGEEGFDAHPLAVETTGLCGQITVGNQVNRFLFALSPPENDQNWTIVTVCELDIR